MVRTTPDDDRDIKVLDDIKQHGWHLVGIEADAEGPAYSFSVGIFHTLGHPDVCIFGLSNASAMWPILNHIGRLVREGQSFDDWHESEEVLEGYPCMFRSVPPEHYHAYFGYARWFYEGNGFPMLQCVWPDRSGRFPWDPEYDARMIEAQPVLADISD